MEIAEKIRAVGIKSTSQRRIVYKVLSERGHASAEEIATSVRKADPSITVATVYRILESFKAAGLIAELSTATGKLHYDITSSTHHHVYMPDGEIVDLEDSEIEQIISSYFMGKMINGKSIKSVKLQVYVD